MGSSSHFVVSPTACAPKFLRFGQAKTRSLSLSVLIELRCSSLPFLYQRTTEDGLAQRLSLSRAITHRCRLVLVLFSPFLQPGVSAERDHTPFEQESFPRRLRLHPFYASIPFFLASFCLFSFSNPAYPPRVIRHRSTGTFQEPAPLLFLLFFFCCSPSGYTPDSPLFGCFVSRVRDL